MAPNVPSSASSAEILARYLNRADCIWMASPSLALLSALVAGRVRPTKLLVHEASPPFAAGLGRIVGAIPEMTPGEDGAELRHALRQVASNPDGVWGIATHRPGALVSPDWFAAFEASSIPTIELCLSGAFDLAGRDRPRATVTIVSLDTQPPFEGVQITGLLTDDAAFAMRLRALCFNQTGGDSAVFDATPRGLMADEDALRTVLETSIARHETELRERFSRKADTPATAPLSLVWRRVFKGGEDETPRDPHSGIEPPVLRGGNSLMARLAEAEQLHGRTVAEFNARLESVHAQSREQAARFQADIETLERRRAEAEAATNERAQQDSVALRAAQDRIAEFERRFADLGAAASSRDSAAEILANEKAVLREALEKATKDLESANDKAGRIEGERLAALAEIGRQEEALSAANERTAAIEAQFRGAQDKAGAEAARAAAAHAESQALLEAEIRSVREQQAREVSRLNSELTEERARLQAENKTKRQARESKDKDREKEIVRLAASVSEGEKKRASLEARTRELEKERADALANLARAEELAAKLKQQEAATTEEREAALARLAKAEASHEEALRVAEARIAAMQALQQEGTEEVAVLNSAIADLRLRFDAAAEASAQETRGMEAAHATAMGGLAASVSEGERTRLTLETRNRELEKERADALADLVRAQEQTARLKEQEAAAAEERDTALARLAKVEASHREATRLSEERLSALEHTGADEVAALNSALADWRVRFEGAADASARESRRIETAHAAVMARMREEATELRAQAELRAKDHERETARLAATAADSENNRLALEKRAHELEQQRAEALADLARAEAQGSTFEEQHEAAARERDDALKSLAQAREAGQEALRLAEERAEEISRLNSELAEHEKRLQTAAEISTKETQRAQAAQAVAAARMRKDAAEFRAQAERQAQDHAQAIARLAASAAESEKNRLALEARARELEQERAEEISRLNSALAEREKRLQTVADTSTKETQRTEAVHAVAAARMRKEAAELRAQAERQARDHEQEIARLAASAAESEKSRLALEARAGELEQDRARAEEQASLFKKQQETAGRERDAALKSLAQAQEAGQEALRLAEERAEAISRLNSELAERQARLGAAAEVSTKETQRIEAVHAVAAARMRQETAELRAQAERQAQDHGLEIARLAASAAESEKNRLALEARARELEQERAQSLASVARAEEQASLFKKQHEAAARERDEALARLARAEGGHQEGLRLAEERIAAAQALQQKGADEAAALNAAIVEWRTRFDAAAEASTRETRKIETLVAQGDREAAAQKKEMAAVADRAALLQSEKAALVSERDSIRARLAQVEEASRQALELVEKRAVEAPSAERKRIEEIAKLSAALAESRRVAEAEAKQAAGAINSLETRHATAAARLQEEALHSKGLADAASKEAAILAARFAAVEKDRAALVRERDSLTARLERSEALNRTTVQVAEEQASAQAQLAMNEISGLKAATADLQSRFDETAKAAAAELRRVTDLHSKQVAQLETQVAALKAGDAKGQLPQKEATDLRERLLRLERDNATALSERDEVHAQLKQREEEHRGALRAIEERANRAELEKAGEKKRLLAEVAAWRGRFDGTASVAAEEKRRLEESHAGAQAVFQEELDRVRQDTAVRDRELKAARDLADRLAALEQENSSLRSKLKETTARMRKREEHRGETLPSMENWISESEKAEVASSVAEEWQSRLAAAVAAHEKEMTTLRAQLSSLGGEALAKATAPAATDSAPPMSEISKITPTSTSPPKWQFEKVIHSMPAKRPRTLLERVSRRLRGKR